MAKKRGIESKIANYDHVRTHIQNAIDTIAPHDSIERYEGLGVTVFQGHATLTSKHSIQIDNKTTITSKYITIATGATPFIPPIKGLNDIPYDTAETIWDMKKLPKSMIIVGSGPIGCELGQAYGRLGVNVTIITQDSRILANEDCDVSETMTHIFQQENITVICNATLQHCTHQNGDYTVTINRGDTVQSVHGERLIIATGRRADTTQLGLENVGVTLNKNGTIWVNNHMQTSIPNIYAVGDVASPHQFTHMAGHTAWYATLNIMVGRFKKFKVPYKAIPKITYTDPEVASVGNTSPNAQECTIIYYDLSTLDRAVADGVKNGFVKIWVKKNSDTIVGASVVAPRAGEMLAEITLAMQNDLGLNKIISTIHPYPSYSEAIKLAAIQWKKQNTAPWIMRWVKKLSKHLI